MEEPSGQQRFADSNVLGNHRNIQGEISFDLGGIQRSHDQESRKQEMEERQLDQDRRASSVSKSLNFKGPHKNANALNTLFANTHLSPRHEQSPTESKVSRWGTQYISKVKKSSQMAKSVDVSVDRDNL